MGLIDSKFKINAPYKYTEAENKLIGEFLALSEVEMYDFWTKIDGGDWAVLKKNLKDHYIRVQDYQCPYCLQRIEVDHNGNWDAEHIIPRKSHPHFAFEVLNLCVSCKDCNGAKADKKTVFSRVKKKFSSDTDDYLICHPHFDEYSDHVKVVSVAGFYMPRTAKGKTLIEVCGLLRFLFKFSGYECDVVEIQKKSFELNHLLQESKDPLVLSYVFDCLEDLGREGKRMLREKRMAAV
jgi:hypothetical protein